MKSTPFSLLIILSTLSLFPYLARAQTAPTKAYTYMQVFYYGPKTSPGFAFMSFTPAFHNQTEVRLDEPSIAEAMFSPLLGEPQKAEVVEVTTDIDDLEAKYKDPKYRAAMKKRQDKEKQEFEKQIKALEGRGQKMRDTLIKTLNAATTEGWEVVQMSSYGDSGLTYLLRRAK
ncbi:hypothetical protein [Hymenobacter sp. HDW8]|uniref:hypothetical protein n=1 Tax=Hymenobacter sp. HDW8 TaxID=2714932 RepID=UPI0014079841|nr:hypothetical protein [Hymenobacter sp. HDW8]QIL77299.1 hypothetical protein G7064_16690 [Hymenobacter sp. HDW8]